MTMDNINTELAVEHTDADAARFTTQNNRLCDRSRPDFNAGLHKYCLAVEEDLSLIQCVVCHRVWEKKD